MSLNFPKFYMTTIILLSLYYLRREVRREMIFNLTSSDYGLQKELLNKKYFWRVLKKYIEIILKKRFK